MTISTAPIPDAAAPSESRAAAPVPGHWIEIAEGHDDLVKHRAAWESLARDAA